MKAEKTSVNLVEAVCLRPGMNLHIADFKRHEAAESRFESSNAVVRFYFHIAASGYWELRSPQERASRRTLNHSDLLSTVLFYPEVEGKMCLPADRRQFHLSISLEPSVLRACLGDDLENFSKDVRAISEGCENIGFYHGGPLSRSMTAAFGQLTGCPYTGALRQLYMESRAIELITHKLAQIALPKTSRVVQSKPDLDQVERVRCAERILRSNLEYPPKLLELAHSVGTNHCALNKGFRELFGNTVFGHLRQMRLTEAKRLIEEEQMSVTEAAVAVGYNSTPSFCRAFLAFFGHTPKPRLRKRS